MADNLNIKGIADTEQQPGRRIKPKGKRRKSWAIEVRYPRPEGETPGLYRLFSKLAEWHVYSRYDTESRRDQAFSALVKKSHLDYPYGGRAPQYRKVDPDV